ncbi:MAG: endonuclease domain-containing protein [Saprospiraceae bacterium]|nr:endonuclease domain-containing protein [Saprospiraceae bacterium]
MNYKTILSFARELRKNQTPAEKVFWEKVRGRRFMGKKFSRQYVIEHADILGKKFYYIADFYCDEKRLIVEIDGGIHATQVEYDQIREAVLIEMNYQIMRFKNEEVLNEWGLVEERLRGVLS